MAITFEEEKQFNWKALIIAVVAGIVIIGGAYFLFFAPVPAIEVIAPPSVRSASELSGVEFDPTSVVNSEDFRSLRRYVGQQTTGKTERVNPFIKY